MSILQKSHCTDPIMSALIEWMEERKMLGHYNDQHDTLFPESLDLWCGAGELKACLTICDGAVKVETYNYEDLSRFDEYRIRLSDPDLFDQLLVVIKSIGATVEG